MTVNEYWNIVNNIQVGKTPGEVRQRCNEAEKLIRADKTMDNDTFDELMMAIAFLYREAK